MHISKGKVNLVLVHMYDYIRTYLLFSARSVPKRGTKDKQIDKQIDKPSPHIRSRLNWEHVVIGARHAHADPPIASVQAYRFTFSEGSFGCSVGIQLSILIYMSNSHSAMHV